MVTRGETRETADSSPPRVWLGLALLAAAMLRFWALPQGVPFSPGVDEPEVMERAVRMMKTADFNPHFFDYPSLYIYVQAAVAVARFTFGAMRGLWGGLAQAPTEEFYVWGRAVTAILGTATVWIVYRAGRRWGGRTALLSAVLLAVMPLHVRESHYVLTDVPATFLVMLTFLFSLRAHEQATAWSFAMAGAAAGLAGATKYNGVLAVLMPLIACVMTPARPSRAVATLCIFGAMVAAFLLAAPYTMLDLPTFLNSFARLSSEYRAPPVTPEPIWLIYLKHLQIALHWPGSLVVMAGIGLGFRRLWTGPGRLKWALVTLFPLAYFRFISGQNIFYGRYLLPLVPFLSIMTGAAVVWTVGWLRRGQISPQIRSAAVVVLILSVIAPPTYTSIGYDAGAAKVWTTEQAYDWIRRELAAGTRIQLEGSLAIKLPTTFRTSYVKQLRLAGVEDYAKTDIEYLVASSQCFGEYFQNPEKTPKEYAEYQRIFAQTEEVARFKETPDHPGSELIILKVKR